MFHRRFTFICPDDVIETDVIIVPAEDWPQRPESQSPLWSVTWFWPTEDLQLAVAVRDAVRPPVMRTV